MDVNGLRFRQMAGPRDFGFARDAVGAKVAAHLSMSARTGHLQLASEQPAPVAAEDESFARRMVSRVSPVADGQGGFAWWNAATNRIEARDFDSLPDQLDVDDLGGPLAASDMMLGIDDVLTIARPGGVIWHDLRDRWPDALVSDADIDVHLLAPDPAGGGWGFDRGRRMLVRITGTPLRFAEVRGGSVADFAPADPNPDPPRLVPVSGARVPDRFDIVAMACSAAGRLALIGWESGADAALFLFEDGRFVEHGRMSGLRFPYALAWIGEDRVAVQASAGDAPARQAYTYDTLGAAVAGRALNPGGRIHPLLAPWHGRFCNIVDPVPQHLQADASGAAMAVRPLHALSGGQYARSGHVLIGPIDGGREGCIWHRLYAEAALAANSTIHLQLFAADTDDEPPLPDDLEDANWATHHLSPQRHDGLVAQAPVGAWLEADSEVAQAQPMLACEKRPGTSGLFTLLIQHSARRVRRLTGRYLWIALTLEGDSQATPELAALRAYAGRLSWRDTYLPPFYGEMLSGADAVAPGGATRHDFMERLLHGYEGSLTELEGRIASSWLLTDPATAPDAALPWLGQWVGIAGKPAEAPRRLRQKLIAAPYTAALSGTYGGLLAALELETGGRLVRGGHITDSGRPPGPGQLGIARLGDVATRALMLARPQGAAPVFLTGGAVTKGDIVVVEGFRLRRTFATILGADLADEDDPLTMGLATSGNSYVGDTLILGEAARAELLALYRPEIDEARGDRAAVTNFYAQLAWRVLIMVRGVTDDAEFRRLSDVVADAVPAHVEPRLHHARNPLIVGAASLVGLDTYLAKPEPFAVARLGRSIVGAGDYVAGNGSLLEDLAVRPASAPVAVADGPDEVWAGGDFVLSGLESRAAGDAEISRYIWMWEKE